MNEKNPTSTLVIADHDAATLYDVRLRLKNGTTIDVRLGAIWNDVRSLLDTIKAALVSRDFLEISDADHQIMLRAIRTADVQEVYVEQHS